MTFMKKRKIFISSVQKEFKEERVALRDFVTRDPLCRRYFEVFLFEDMPARDRHPDSVYLEEVRSCDVYVCLLGNEYGAQDSKGISPTEHEFCEATKQGKARLLFIKTGDDDNRHKKTVKLMKKAGGEMIRRRFSNVSELISQVYAALVQYLEDEGILQTVPFDAAVCRGASLSDIDEEYIENFLETARAERKFPLPQNTTAKKLFAHLNLTTDGKISNAGILLFCRKPQKFRHLMCAEVKCMHYHTTEVRKPIPSYQIYKGTLFEQVDEAVDFVLGKLDRSVTPSKTAIASDVAYEIPKMVIREAIVNAVAHRDYTSNAGIQVMLFSDRLEVWNPGALPPGMTMKSLRTEHSSIPRNPLISEPLFWARYIERAGTGTLDMIALCRKVGIPEPQFEQREGQFVLTIRRKKTAQRKKAQAQVEAQEAQVEAQVELTEWQRNILLACAKGAKSGKELLSIAGYTKRTGNFKKGVQRLLDYELIAHTIPDKPNSRLQKYRLTQKGIGYLRK
jgi:predicted HTH transcriptional regulator